MTTTETDPYLLPGRTPIATVRRWSTMALVVGLGYLTYRAAFTVGGAALDAAFLLLLAELLTLVIFAIRTYAAWHEPSHAEEMPDASPPPTVVVVDAAGAGPSDVRTTLVSCRRLRGVERVLVADVAGDPGVRRVADRFGAEVVEAGAVGTAADTSATWVLLIRAGDLPLPDALELLATTCSSPEVGVVQLGVEHANPSSFEYDPADAWSLAPFDHQVVRPSMAARGSMLWHGDVPAMVRPVAIRAGAAEELPPVVLGLHAMSAGFRVTMVPRTLARLRGPSSLGESLRQRFEQTAEVRRRAPEAIRLAPSAVRRQFVVALADPLAAVQRFTLVLVAVLALGLGRLPVSAGALPLVPVAALAYGVRWRAQSLLGRGRLGRFRVVRSELRTIGVDMAFGHGRGARHLRSGLLLLGGMAVAVGAAGGVGAMAIGTDSSERLPDGAAAVALVLSAGFLIASAQVLLDAMARRQARGNHRIRLGLVTGRLGDHDGQLRDLSMGGVGMVVAAERGDVPDRGSESVISFRIPDADGAWRDVITAARVAHVTEVGDGELRVGLAFLDPVDAALDPVVEFLTIDRRLVSLGRRAPSPDDGASAGLS